MRKFSIFTLAALFVFAVGAWAQNSIDLVAAPRVNWVENGKAQIAWSTHQQTAGQDMVRLGTEPNNLWQTIVARQDQREHNGDWNHMAQLVNLQPGQRYFFQIISQGSQGVLTSPVGSFVANGSNGQGAFQVFYPYNQQGYNQGAYNPYNSNQGTYSNQGSYNQGSYSETSTGNNGSLRISNGPNVKDTSANSATIAWSTTQSGHSLVRFGTSPGQFSKAVNDEVNTNAREQNGDYNHTVHLTGLQPNTTYYFVVETNGVRSAPQQFRTSGS